MLLLALGVLLAGILLGAAGMRRAGRLTQRIVGPWRPGVGVGALIALFGAAALVARGAVAEGAVLGVLGAVLAMGARRRGKAPSPSSAMSEAEARGMLGVGPDAGPEEVEAAYRRLMRRVHPDVGGAVGLAAQLNAARETLIGKADAG